MKVKFALWLAAIAAILLAFDIVLGLLLWSSMDSSEREVLSRVLLEHAGVIALLGFFALTGLGFLLRIVFNAYVLTPKWIADEARIILGANPAHRIKPAGVAELRELCDSINTLAERYDSQRREVDEKVAEARSDVEGEKNRLAALMAQLALSVVVCNVDGRIILYNSAAKTLLGQTGWIGLGRSIFAVLDRALIAHALDDIRYRLREGDEKPVANLITARDRGQLVRMNVSPVLDRENEITGFVLTLEDVTKSMETSSRRDELLRSVIESTRAALANMRAAVETILEYPEMKLERRAQFTGIIAEEARKLSAQLEQTLGESSDYFKAKVPVESIPAADLLSVIGRRIESRLGIKAELGTADRDLWLKVDSYAMAQSACFLARRLMDRCGVRRITLSIQPSGRLANLDLAWAGPALDSDVVAAWESEPLKQGGEEGLLNLKQILARHDAEFLHQHEAGQSFFRIILPVAEAAPAARHAVYESRPEYYDFDLFNRSASEHDERKLTELTYTVFDTETTGLDPSAGDEIISIGAVRIVNNRVLQHEVFDQLVDPKRPVSKKSTAVHGITREMLQGAPPIGEVLPHFFHFCADTVLVAHNAAFDMRFLQLKEDTTGVKFDQPVLDTLLLSPVVHPYDPEHRLEAMAQRLGISVMGRHTALGDAFVTAEVFLRMIPVLGQKGIHTLKQAQQASQKTQYAKVTY